MATYEIQYKRRRINNEPSQSVRNAADANKYLRKNCFSRDEMWREKAYAVYLNRQNEVIAHLQLSIGGLTHTVLDKRLVIKGALDSLADGVIIAHNHPSGDSIPSKNDIQETDELRRVCSAMGIKLIDHIVLSEKEFFSFNDDVKTTLRS